MHNGEVSAEIKKRSLTNAEAAFRLRQYGHNVVFDKKKIHPVFIFLNKFKNPLLIILLVASAVSFALGERINAVILVAMVFLSAVLEFVNTYKSEMAVEKLVAKVITTATVIRDELAQEIPLRRIVPGDIILLSAGDVVPADSAVLESRDFFVNEAALTGESFPQEKGVNADVFMGTSITSGFAAAEVKTTGKGTEYGQIAQRLGTADTETNFEKDIKKFSFFIMKVSLALVSLVFIINAVVGRGWLTSFIFALAIAVGLTPELLPVIMTVSLSRGSVVMSKKNVIVKNLSAIENFGSMDIFCTDKTGTLTEDRIVLVKCVDVLGVESEEVLEKAFVSSTFRTGVSNSLDSAVKEFKNHLNISDFKKVDEIPFDFERKRDSIVAEHDGKRFIITKGAPEQIFEVCSLYKEKGKSKKLDKAGTVKIYEQFNELSREGFRVLGIAVKNVAVEAGKEVRVYSKEEEQGMEFVGFVCFLDPAKEGALEAINELEKLGVELKILTGDHALLAQKVCKDVDIKVKGVVTGEMLEHLSDEKLTDIAIRNTVFARVSPTQKERIITLLRAAGNTVGYLGDGINDAPGLKAADVGISVNNAVDVAKETADIILLKKSLMVLKEGIIEGRKTFRNTFKYMLMSLSSNFGNMFSMMAASAFLPFLPMLPGQVLLNNFLYDSAQLSLSTDKVDEEDIKNPPELNMDFLKKYMMVFGIISSIFDFITFFMLYKVFNLMESQFQTGWFVESIFTQIFVIYIIRTRKIPFLQSSPSKLLVFNTLLAIAVAMIIPITPLSRLFGFTRSPVMVLVAIFVIVGAYLFTAEIAKRAFYRRFKVV